MTTTGSGALRLRRLLARRRASQLAERPRTAYELLTRQMVEQLGRDLADLRRRVDQLFTTVVGAILLELLLRLWG
ncbi:MULTISPECIES: hypothetical protein [Thermomicrobium]|jgi:hypothetical protein|uniref:Uncharacterized protein n=1 Tax=Thermomicrobium roseum (strain ATCC 27502 / DSM 5159 / P-2) TaxID=309801 RepID=B9L0F2_THERP|nr:MULTISPECIES: hypothetical protein [Thermomicrobium]ACM05673.1 hypothetical protein trd_1645 [Thermomicrobium roseum DSM 5159]MBO9360511.1 hypothetical protein [Thermomicrobium sp.]